MRRIPSRGVDFVHIRSDAGRTLLVMLDAPCPCESSRPARTCCMMTGKLELPPDGAATSPPPPRTGLAHPRCYARSLGDCSAKISREHYFSKNLMLAFADGEGRTTIRIERPDGTAQELPPAQALQANILCQRHNSALSPLDAIGGRVFRAVREGLKPAPSFNLRAVAGIDFERWLAKVACGFRAASRREVPDDWLWFLFGFVELPRPLGFYTLARLGVPAFEPRGIRFAEYSNARKQSGAEVIFDGVRFTLDLTGDGRVRSDAHETRVYRPTGVWFDRAGATVFHLGFEWGARPTDARSVAASLA